MYLKKSFLKSWNFKSPFPHLNFFFLKGISNSAKINATIYEQRLIFYFSKTLFFCLKKFPKNRSWYHQNSSHLIKVTKSFVFKKWTKKILPQNFLHLYLFWKYKQKFLYERDFFKYPPWWNCNKFLKRKEKQKFYHYYSIWQIFQYIYFWDKHFLLLNYYCFFIIIARLA